MVRFRGGVGRAGGRVAPAILKGRGATETYEPWVRRMPPENRLFIRLASNAPPPVPGIEWYQVEFSIWSGRLPKQLPALAR
jgi:hypothetical protein